MKVIKNNCEKHITLKELSKETGIPYTTLRDWKNLGITYEDNWNWRIFLINYLEDVKILEKKVITKVENLFLEEEKLVFNRLLILAMYDDTLCVSKDLTKWLEEQIDHFYFYIFNKYHEFDDDKRKSLIFAIKEKSKKLCEFEIYVYAKYIFGLELMKEKI